MCSYCQHRFLLAGSLFEGQFIFTFDFYYLMPAFSRAQVLKPFVLRILMLTHFVVLILLEVHNIFIASIEDGAAPLSSLIPSYLTIGKLDRKALRHSLNPSYRASRDLNHDASSIDIYITHLFLPVRRLQPELSMGSRHLTLGARFRQALGSPNRPLYPGREWRLLGQH